MDLGTPSPLIWIEAQKEQVCGEGVGMQTWGSLLSLSSGSQNETSQEYWS